MFCLFLGPIFEFLREKYDTYKTKRKCPNIFKDVVPPLFLSLQWLLVGLKWCICKTLLTKTVLLQKRVLGENGLQVIKKYLIQEE